MNFENQVPTEIKHPSEVRQSFSFFSTPGNGFKDSSLRLLPTGSTFFGKLTLRSQSPNELSLKSCPVEFRVFGFDWKPGMLEEG